MTVSGVVGNEVFMWIFNVKEAEDPHEEIHVFDEPVLAVSVSGPLVAIVVAKEDAFQVVIKNMSAAACNEQFDGETYPGSGLYTTIEPLASGFGFIVNGNMNIQLLEKGKPGDYNFELVVSEQ